MGWGGEGKGEGGGPINFLGRRLVAELLLPRLKEKGFFNLPILFVCVNVFESV